MMHLYNKECLIMKSQFAERTLIMIALAVVLASFLAVSGLLALGASTGFAPVPTAVSKVSDSAGNILLSKLQP